MSTCVAAADVCAEVMAVRLARSLVGGSANDAVVSVGYERIESARQCAGTESSFGLVDGGCEEVLGLTPDGDLVVRADQLGQTHLKVIRSPDELVVDRAVPAGARMWLSGDMVYVSHDGGLFVVAARETGSPRLLRQPVPTAGTIAATGASSLALASSDAEHVQVAVVDATGRTVEWTVPVERSVTAVSVSPERTFAALLTVDRQVHIVRLADGVRHECVPGAVCAPQWASEDRCVWASRVEQQTTLTQWSAQHGRLVNQSTEWTVSEVVAARDGVFVSATRPRTPRQHLSWDAALTPVTPSRTGAGTVDTSDGPLNTLWHLPDGRSVGLAILFRGGPYGHWLPGWDPWVDLCVAHGLTAVQLESPYTAAVHRRLPSFRRGQFGHRDANLAAEAIAALNPLGLPIVLIGHSYGAFLAAQVARLGVLPVRGLATLSGPWTETDLIELADHVEVGPPGSLTDFLSRGMRTSIPADVAPTGVPNWLVLYGAEDEIVPPSVYRAAVRRDRPRHAVELTGEGHAARSRAGVVRVLQALDEVLHGTLDRVGDES